MKCKTFPFLNLILAKVTFLFHMKFQLRHPTSELKLIRWIWKGHKFDWERERVCPNISFSPKRGLLHLLNLRTCSMFIIPHIWIFCEKYELRLCPPHLTFVFVTAFSGVLTPYILRLSDIHVFSLLRQNFNYERGSILVKCSFTRKLKILQILEEISVSYDFLLR